MKREDDVNCENTKQFKRSDTIVVAVIAIYAIAKQKKQKTFRFYLNVTSIISIYNKWLQNHSFVNFRSMDFPTNFGVGDVKMMNCIWKKLNYQ